jgi:hypothetical protein
MLDAGLAIAEARAADAGTALEERAGARLRASSYSALKNLSCQFQDGVLVLRGELGSYYLKQLAQVMIVGIVGIARIENQIEVSPAHPHPASAIHVEVE